MHNQIWPTDSTLEAQLGSRITNPPADRRQSWSELHTFSTWFVFHSPWTVLPSSRTSSAGCAAPLLRSGSCFSTADSSGGMRAEWAAADRDHREPGREERITAPLQTEPADRRSGPWDARALGPWRVARKVGARGRCARRVRSGANEIRTYRVIIHENKVHLRIWHADRQVASQVILWISALFKRDGKKSYTWMIDICFEA